MLCKEFNTSYDIMRLAAANVIILQAYSFNRKLCEYLAANFSSAVAARPGLHPLE